MVAVMISVLVTLRTGTQGLSDTATYKIMSILAAATGKSISSSMREASVAISAELRQNHAGACGCVGCRHSSDIATPSKNEPNTFNTKTGHGNATK